MLGLPFSPEPVDLARVALKLLEVVGKGNERNRQPTDNELNTLLDYGRPPAPVTLEGDEVLTQDPRLTAPIVCGGETETSDCLVIAAR